MEEDPLRSGLACSTRSIRRQFRAAKSSSFSGQQQQQRRCCYAQGGHNFFRTYEFGEFTASASLYHIGNADITPPSSSPRLLAVEKEGEREHIVHFMTSNKAMMMWLASSYAFGLKFNSVVEIVGVTRRN